MSDKAIKVALIGTGGWGRQHARIFAQRSDIDFCAVAGRDPARTAAVMRRQRIHHELEIPMNPHAQIPNRIAARGFGALGTVADIGAETAPAVNGWLTCPTTADTLGAMGAVRHSM